MFIEIKNVSKSYKKDHYVLKDINLELRSPEMIGLVGPNGAGKTTLMKLLIAQLQPSKGSIVVDGYNLARNEKYLKSRVGYLPQEFGLYDELTIEQFLDYMACVKGMSKNRKEDIYRCMKETNLLDKRKDKIKTLSGGQRQRVGIAQALINKPELFVVDEPTVGLDPEERIKFRNLFSTNASDKLVILSTHIIDDVQSICSRLIVMDQGCILFDGAPSKLVKQAEGYVAVLEIESEHYVLKEEGFKIMSRIVTAEGLRYRIVGNSFPKNSQIVPPSLEDAYVYCIMRNKENMISKSGKEA